MENKQIILLGLAVCVCLICLSGSIGVGYLMSTGAGQGTVSANPLQWVSVPTTYVPGKAVGSCIENTTLEDCRERCRKNTLCRSFDFGNKGTKREGKCCLNSATEPVKQSLNYTSYRKIGG